MSKVLVIDKTRLLEEIEDLDSIDHGGVPYVPLQSVKNIIWGFCELKDVIKFEAEIEHLGPDQRDYRLMIELPYQLKNKFRGIDKLQVLVVRGGK